MSDAFYDGLSPREAASFLSARLGFRVTAGMVRRDRRRRAEKSRRP